MAWTQLRPSSSSSSPRRASSVTKPVRPHGRRHFEVWRRAEHGVGEGLERGRKVKLRRLGLLLSGVAGAMLAIGALAEATAHASARASALEPRSLARAQTIRAQMNARYRLVRGHKLVVTEASSMGVVDSLTLFTDQLMPRIVSADNGIYFAICSARAGCPYPARSAAWPARTLLPRRLALELALRTFLKTSVSLVVVALPTAEPVWVVFERDDLLASVDAPAMRDRLGPLELANSELIDLVDQITRGRLFRPLPILPPPDDTIYAVRLLEP